SRAKLTRPSMMLSTIISDWPLVVRVGSRVSASKPEAWTRMPPCLGVRPAGAAAAGGAAGGRAGAWGRAGRGGRGGRPGGGGGRPGGGGGGRGGRAARAGGEERGAGDAETGAGRPQELPAAQSSAGPARVGRIMVSRHGDYLLGRGAPAPG